MKRSRVLALCSSVPSSHRIRDITKSSVAGSGSSVPRATRLRKIVPLGMSLPIFSAMRKLPSGVLKLPS